MLKSPSQIHLEINSILKDAILKNEDDSMIKIKQLLTTTDMSPQDILDYLDELDHFLMVNSDVFDFDLRFIFALNSIHNLWIF